MKLCQYVSYKLQQNKTGFIKQDCIHCAAADYI